MLTMLMQKLLDIKKRSGKPLVLVACEFSGCVRDAMTRQGLLAISCDLLPTETPGLHVQGNVADIIDYPWDLIIAHPPCTYLSHAGIGWFYDHRTAISGMKRIDKMVDAAIFFKMFLDAPCNKIAVENPKMHPFAINAVGRKQNFSIQPWQFGDPYNKFTCFWTKGLSNLTPTSIIQRACVDRDWHKKIPRCPDRWKIRSRTFPGVAEAIAQQWGSPLL